MSATREFAQRENLVSNMLSLKPFTSRKGGENAEIQSNGPAAKRGSILNGIGTNPKMVEVQNSTIIEILAVKKSIEVLSRFS